MTLAHLQLNAPDLETQVLFYEKYFEFKRKKFQEGWLLWNRAGFMIAVNPMAELARMPDWFHVGFRFETQAEVTALYDRLRGDGVKLGKITHDVDYMQFRFPDPSGYIVEVFWSPPPQLWS